MSEFIEELELVSLENLDLKIANLTIQGELLKKQKEELERKLVDKYRLDPEDRIDPKTRQIHRVPSPVTPELVEVEPVL